MTKRNKLMSFIVVIVLITLACGSETPSQGSSANTSVEQADGSQPEDNSSQAQAPTPTPLPPTETPNPNLLAQGTYLVGSDIQPGLFRGMAGTDFLDSCYWERLSDLSGEFDAILANDNSQGQFYIQVLDTDFALSVDCEVEYLPELPSANGEFPTTIEVGTYLIGIDIQPGTYRGQAGDDFADSCYWERKRNVTGEFDDIIANDNATGQYYVQLAASDFAFETSCPMERTGD